VEECLKQALSHGSIENRACRLEVAGLIEESKADINVDPLLQRACLLDITKYCDEVPEGAGRREFLYIRLYTNYVIY
jgi:Golgi apparatus protein 1